MLAFIWKSIEKEESCYLKSVNISIDIESIEQFFGLKKRAKRNLKTVETSEY
jgi:hypothetical protein